MTRVYAAIEAVLLGTASIIAGSITHLTWWNAALLAFSDVAYVWNPEGYVFKRLWLASASLSVLVQLTVVVMSVKGCSMIRDTLKDIGPWLYYFGNFALHYWPTLRAAAIRPNLKKATAVLCFDAARIVAVYATFYSPEVVYACENVHALVVLPLGIAAALAIEWLVLRAASTPPARFFGVWS